MIIFSKYKTIEKKITLNKNILLLGVIIMKNIMNCLPRGRILSFTRFQIRIVTDNKTIYLDI